MSTNHFFVALHKFTTSEGVKHPTDRYLVKFLRHSSDDFRVLHVPEHLPTDHTWKEGETTLDRVTPPWGHRHFTPVERLFLCVISHTHTHTPLHPEHCMKKLMRSRRATSRSVLYDSIQSSTTDCRKITLNMLLKHQ